MGLRPFEPNIYKMEYVPQRLAALEVCVHACYAALKRRIDQPTPTCVDFGVVGLGFANPDILLGIALDAGLIANRTLLNFVGIKLDNHDLTNKEYALTISKFELPHVDVDLAIKILESDGIPAAEMRRIWIDSLRVASGSAAHFTANGAEIHVARIGFACYATSLLVREYFFRMLDEAIPESLITEQVRPTLRGDHSWHYVDPSHGLMC
ncbi:hypothetical protein bAD24_I10815 [Burkholderia sp. AD24]|nr:hypothetical protein bAD24_I10815 [Burkholderia sp. AD24]